MILNNELYLIKEKIEEEIYPVIKEYKKIIAFNQEKILQAFISKKISDFHFQNSSGYGYGDIGRDILEELYSMIFCAEDALVRHNIISGTHAIYLALRAVLESDDILLTIGKPYDTLQKVIGISGNEKHSLKNQGIKCFEVPFEAYKNFKLLDSYLIKKPKAIFIQRSRGYSIRKTLTINEIANLIKYIKSFNKGIIIVVDNCYGEFVENKEPTQLGADVLAGSLIKNPGGGIAPYGGYLVGKKNIINAACSYLTAPGLGKDMGASNIDKRLLFQGLFMSPLIVMQALETAIFAAKLFSDNGFKVYPKYDDKRSDIIQAIILNEKDKLIKFCHIIQSISPVDAFHVPVPDIMPGYDHEVIMAAGTFIQGASIELSADAPIREPYAVYLQGSLSAEHGKIALLKTFEQLVK